MSVFECCEHCYDPCDQPHDQPCDSCPEFWCDAMSPVPLPGGWASKCEDERDHVGTHWASGIGHFLD